MGFGRLLEEIVIPFSSERRWVLCFPLGMSGSSRHFYFRLKEL
jgi:hypothetical protein